jgi:hypothetical protein
MIAQPPPSWATTKSLATFTDRCDHVDTQHQ